MINNAGIQRVHDFTHGEAVRDEVVRQEIDTNLLGLIRVSAALLWVSLRCPGSRSIGPRKPRSTGSVSRFGINCEAPE